MTNRDAYRLRKASDKCRQEKYTTVQVGNTQFKPSAHAILVELSLQRSEIPMYISAGAYEQAASVLQCNIELGAFLRIVPLMGETSPSESDALSRFKYILSVQKIL